jgi:hypothetical protein
VIASSTTWSNGGASLATGALSEQAASLLKAHDTCRRMGMAMGTRPHPPC